MPSVAGLLHRNIRTMRRVYGRRPILVLLARARRPWVLTTILKAIEKVEAKAQEDRGPSARGIGERHRHRERRVQGHRHRQVDRAADGRAHRLRRAPTCLTSMEPGLKEGAFYDPTGSAFPAGAYICEMEVDSATGREHLGVDFVAADDFGRLINTMIVEGQVHGGLAQGIGQALLEGAVLRQFRPAPDGLVHGTHHAARGSCRPSSCRIPRRCLPGNPLSIKGCGEAGAIGASAAVINAITDAIGNNQLEMPATPDRVWHAIHGWRKTSYPDNAHRPSFGRRSGRACSPRARTRNIWPAATR